MPKYPLFFVICALALSVFVLPPAQAQDTSYDETMSKSAGDWMVRLRGIGVIPNEDEDVRPVGGSADIDNAVVPELDISYFFTDHIAAELILATAPHGANLENSTAGDVDLGEVWLLPPTLTLQYHFDTFGDWNISPYVGAGVNYTFFYAEDRSSQLSALDYDNSVGYALQAGVDIPIDHQWYLNLDVKRLWLDTDLDATVIGVGNVDADIDIDPWILGAGIAYRF